MLKQISKLFYDYQIEHVGRCDITCNKKNTIL